MTLSHTYRLDYYTDYAANSHGEKRKRKKNRTKIDFTSSSYINLKRGALPGYKMDRNADTLRAKLFSL